MFLMFWCIFFKMFSETSFLKSIEILLSVTLNSSISSLFSSMISSNFFIKLIFLIIPVPTTDILEISFCRKTEADRFRLSHRLPGRRKFRIYKSSPAYIPRNMHPSQTLPDRGIVLIFRTWKDFAYCVRKWSCSDRKNLFCSRDP